MGKAEWPGFFFLLDHVHEFASPAVMQFLSKRPLNLAAAERTRYCPAGPAGIFSSMNTVKRLHRRHRADAEFRRFMSARLAATLLELPAIHLFHALTSNCMSPVGGTIFQNLSRHRPPSASIRRYDLSKQV